MESWNELPTSKCGWIKKGKDTIEFQSILNWKFHKYINGKECI